MRDGSVLILSGKEVGEICAGRELEILEAVRAAYRAHGRGESALPHSTFLRFPDDESNRIIALPAYLGDAFAVAGVKWIASFPGNVDRGMARASALLVLNSTSNGRPEVVLEGSLVSALRTAASAAVRPAHGGERRRRGARPARRRQPAGGGTRRRRRHPAADGALPCL